MKVKNFFKILLVFILITGFKAPVGALAWSNLPKITSEKFEHTNIEEGVALQLQGRAVKSVFFMKAFVASLYVDKTAIGQDPLQDISKELEVEYFIHIPAAKLNRFTVDTMKDNITKDEFDKIKPKVEMMRGYFVDLKPGDKFALSYSPNSGTKFIHNGTLVGTIEGREFAYALFAVWFGQKPFDLHLKSQILNLKYKSNGQDHRREKN